MLELITEEEDGEAHPRGLGRSEGTYPGEMKELERPAPDQSRIPGLVGLAAVSVAQVAKHRCRQQQEADEDWKRHTRGSMQQKAPVGPEKETDSARFKVSRKPTRENLS